MRQDMQQHITAKKAQQKSFPFTTFPVKISFFSRDSDYAKVVFPIPTAECPFLPYK